MAEPHDPPAGVDLAALSEPGRRSVEYYRRALSDLAPGQAPPAFDGFLHDVPETERDHLRAVLEHFTRQRTLAAGPDPGAVTTDFTPGPAPDEAAGPLRRGPKTVDRGRDRTVAHAGPVAEARPTGEPAGWTAVPGYEILDVLGRGGMGVVYRARQTRLNRLVALKVIAGGGHASPEYLRRFKAEAEAVARLQHPHIVQIYDVGEHDGLPFLALEFVPGGSLDRKLRRELPAPGAAARLLEPLARAMAYAHSQGIVHRDLKPANILLSSTFQVQGSTLESPSGNVQPETLNFELKITDFGLAKGVADADEATRTGAVLGTPSYMAPEQAAGLGKYAGPAADVYALGATLYELLTGRPPFQGPSALDILRQVRSHEPMPPTQVQPGVPRDLETVCLKALAKEPGRRYAGAAELADDLRRFLDGEPIRARPVGAPERLWRWGKRNPRVAALTGTVAVLLAVVALVAGAAAVALSRQNRALRAAQDREQDKARAAQEYAAAAREQAELAQQSLNYLITSIGPQLRERGLAHLQLELIRATEAHLKQVLRTNPAAARLNERSLATVYLQHGDLFRMLGAADPARQQAVEAEAERYYDQARAALERLLAEEPDSDRARGNLALALSRLGRVAFNRREYAKARDRFEESRRLREQVVTRPSGAAADEDTMRPADTRASLAESHELLTVVLPRLPKPEDGRPHAEAALRLREEALQLAVADPHSTLARGPARFREDLAAAYEQAAEQARWQKDEGRAAALRRQAVELRRQVVADEPDQPRHKLELARRYREAGDELVFAKQEAEAHRVYEQIEPLLKDVVENDPSGAARAEAAELFYRLGYTYGRLGDEGQSQACYGECLAIWQDLTRDVTSPGRQWGHMVILARLGRHRDAERVCEAERTRLADASRQPSLPYFWFNAACTYSLCAAAVGAGRPDADLPPEQRELRWQYLDRCLAAVREVVTHRWFTRQKLQTDPDLEFVQGRADFQHLLAWLDAQK
jgi:serine/threonine protein kinase